MSNENKSWCPLPWLGVSIRNNGDYRVCCNANSSASKGLLRSNDGKILNANFAQLSDVRNSEQLKEIRRHMLRGERHETCIRCNREDDAGVRSRRLYEKEFWREKFELKDAIASAEADGSLNEKRSPVGYYDIRFGNLCNLKCRMCGPTDSSLWYKEHYETNGPTFVDSSSTVKLENMLGTIRVEGFNPYGWHESEKFWKETEENLSNVQLMYLVGGEPLLIERHYELLEKLISLGRAKNVILDYNSNIVLLPPRALALWKNFKEVRLGCSIDGYGKINEYIRHPSKWANTEKNLDILDAAEGNLKVWITTTVQIYNVFYLTDLIKWKIERKFRLINNQQNSPWVTTHPLHTAKHFNIKALTPKLKSLVASKFDDFFINWFLPYAHENFSEAERPRLIENMNRLLGGYKSFMYQDDLSALLPKFWKTTQEMDRYRNQSFLETMPEFAEPLLEELQALGGPLPGQLETAPN